MKLGVVDVGGGLRGVYATGILDRCMEQAVRFDCCIGVSAGSANLITYVAGQRGRCKEFYLNYTFRKEYMSVSNLLRTGSYLGLEYIYGALSNSDGEYPLDYAAMVENPAELYVVAENAVTGEAKYFSKADVHPDDYRILMASCCIPGIDRPYMIDGVPYFDGALADPVPVQKAFDLGCDKVVLLLSRPVSVARTPGKDQPLAKLIRKRYPISAEKLARRAEVYNDSVELAKRYAQEGKVLILAPEDTDGVSTLTKNKENLTKLYQRGYRDGAAIQAWLAQNAARP